MRVETSVKTEFIAKTYRIWNSWTYGFFWVVFTRQRDRSPRILCRPPRYRVGACLAHLHKLVRSPESSSHKSLKSKLQIGFSSSEVNLLHHGVIRAIPTRRVRQGQTSGTVLDEQGHAIPNAKITVRNLGTGALREMNSDDQATFIVTNLHPQLMRCWRRLRSNRKRDRQSVRWVRYGCYGY